jgi:hypothetical protein
MDKNSRDTIISGGEKCPECRFEFEEPKALVNLNRYDSIPALLNILQRKKLYLLNPETWSDKNDSELIQKYAAKKGCIVRALCFTMAYDTVWHWETYASSGCLIDFDAPSLFDVVSRVKGVRHGPVQYKAIEDAQREIKTGGINLDDIPFLKRIPYRFEKEYRLIWEGKATKNPPKVKEIPISLDIIKSITISQKLAAPLYQTIRELIEKAGIPYKCIHQTTLHRNSHWLGTFGTLVN